MTWDENMQKTYDQLAADDATAWDVYSSEDCEKIAEEKGIPWEKWADARVAMTMGQGAIEEELENGIPQSDAERERRLYAVIKNQITGNLRGMRSDEERRARVLMTLQGAQQMNENEVAQMALLSIEELEEKLVDLAMDLTKSRVLPALEKQCTLLLHNEEQKASVLNNAGAMAAAVYMNDAHAQDVPVFLGSCAGLIEHCQNVVDAAEQNGKNELLSEYDAQNETSDYNILDIVAYGLLLVSAAIACAVLASFGAVVVSTAVSHVLVEGTVAGIGAAVAADIPLLGGILGEMMKVSLAGTILSVVVKGLACLCRFAEDECPTHTYHTEHYVSNNGN